MNFHFSRGYKEYIQKDFLQMKTFKGFFSTQHLQNCFLTIEESRFFFEEGAFCVWSNYKGYCCGRRHSKWFLTIKYLQGLYFYKNRFFKISSAGLSSLYDLQRVFVLQKTLKSSTFYRRLSSGLLSKDNVYFRQKI